MSHRDIRIGTLAPMNKGADYLRQILPYGFESFSLTFWQKIGDVNVEQVARPILDVIGDRAIISSLSLYGNPLQNEQAVKDIERLIDAAHLFNCNLVTGFTGALDGQPVPEAMPQFKKVWGQLLRRAKDKGVRLAFETCDMGGRWNAAHMNIAFCTAAWEMMFNDLPDDDLGLQWEPCHHLVQLVDPIAQLRRWVKKVLNVHGKDATIAWDVIREHGVRGSRPYAWHRTPGFGDTNWTDVITILRMNKYNGSIDIEGWHDPVYCEELEMTGQVFALNYLKRCRGGDFVPNPT